MGSEVEYSSKFPWGAFFLLRYMLIDALNRVHLSTLRGGPFARSATCLSMLSVGYTFQPMEPPSERNNASRNGVAQQIEPPPDRAMLAAAKGETFRTEPFMVSIYIAIIQRSSESLP